jgi:cell division protein FtsI/penicillin-binding protein 2
LPEASSQRLRRARPVLALAGVSFAIGAIVGGNQGAGSPTRSLAASFVKDWTKGEYAGMYADIDAGSRHSTSAGEFAEAYEKALTTATASGMRVMGPPRAAPGGLISVPVRVRTRLFGTLSLNFELRIERDAEEGVHVEWSPSAVFPGLRPGETLSRRTTLPRRATLLARDGSVLAESPTSSSSEQPESDSRSAPLGTVGSSVVGSVGSIPASRRAALEAEGVPSDATVGVSGVELALDDRLRGSPGGELLAGERVLASVPARAAPPVRSSVSPAIQQAAVTALGGQYGGIVAMEPSTGEVLAVAGIGLDGLQPPGSTFKMITLTGVLEAGVAGPSTVFPYATFATLDGVRLNNANGEDCGGTLTLAFAVSCNSVFTPLGVKLGASRLVATAERFGFNHAPALAGAAESTLPAGSELQGELDIGSTAIGQGKVLASALEMATVAATIADGGHRPAPSFELGARSPGPAATSSSVARTVRRMMIDVVREGTGTSAAIAGVTVAGKTGTAELKSACPHQNGGSTTGETGTSESATKEAGSEACQGTAKEASNTDAWFAAFAPALHPRIVVGVLLVKDGAGGETAAPAAREVLEAGLKSIH